jgi:hypothetical protein
MFLRNVLNMFQTKRSHIQEVVHFRSLTGICFILVVWLNLRPENGNSMFLGNVFKYCRAYGDYTRRVLD